MPQKQYTHLYNNSRWRRRRALYLSEHPMCHYCAEAGRDTPADTVDHYRPHQGDYDLFWDEANWRACCTPCHNHLASIKDTTGIVPGCNRDGEPLDAGHAWYGKGR